MPCRTLETKVYWRSDWDTEPCCKVRLMLEQKQRTVDVMSQNSLMKKCVPVTIDVININARADQKFRNVMTFCPQRQAEHRLTLRIFDRQIRNDTKPINGFSRLHCI